MLRNQKMVWSVVVRYLAPGIDRDDLFQEGCLGLLRAIDKWEPERGLKFSTYALPWVQQHIQRYIDDRTRTVRLPTHLSERLRKIHRVTARLTQELGRPPTDAELVAAVGCTVAQLATAREAERLAHVASLDARQGDDDPEAREAHELVADPAAEDVAEASLAALQAEELRGWLSRLPRRSRLIVERRHGLHGGEPETLQQIAQSIGLTRERVRQLEAEAMAHLRQIATARTARAIAAD